MYCALGCILCTWMRSVYLCVLSTGMCIVYWDVYCVRGSVFQGLISSFAIGGGLGFEGGGMARDVFASSESQLFFTFV